MNHLLTHDTLWLSRRHLDQSLTDLLQLVLNSYLKKKRHDTRDINRDVYEWVSDLEFPRLPDIHVG